MSSKYIFDRYPLEKFEGFYLYETQFEWFLESAMETLAARNEQEIASIIWDIDTYTLQKLKLSYYPDKRISFEELTSKFEREIYPSRSQIVVIQSLMKGQKSPSTISDVKGLTWSECVAGALLGQVMFAYDIEQRYQDMDFSTLGASDFFDNLSEFLGTYAINCMEILILLSSISDQGRYSLPYHAISSGRSIKAKKAAHTRHGPSKEIKENFVSWYNENKSRGIFHSQNQAAVKFLDHIMTDTERTHVSTPATLLRALRQHKKTAT